MQRRHARLGWGLAVLVACDLVVVGVRSVHVRTHAVTDSTPPAAGGRPAPPPGQADVTGQATSISVDGAAGDPIAAPLTLNAERGRGSATIDNAIVNGARTAIVWASGTPLPITGGDGAGLDLGPAHVDLAPTGATWSVDGAARAFTPGTYHAGAAVAIGRGGLATPRDSVDFTADANTTLVTRGGVSVHVEPAPLELAGPGKMTATGAFTVVLSDGERAAKSLAFGPGPFKLTATPEGDHVVVDATLNGPLQTA